MGGRGPGPGGPDPGPGGPGSGSGGSGSGLVGPGVGVGGSGSGFGGSGNQRPRIKPQPGAMVRKENGFGGHFFGFFQKKAKKVRFFETRKTCPPKNRFIC